MPPLYVASVPVFRHYLERARGLVAKTGDDGDLLAARLAPDMFTAAEQFPDLCTVPAEVDHDIVEAGLAQRLDMINDERLAPDFEQRLGRHIG